jgi:hypothetical protein
MTPALEHEARDDDCVEGYAGHDVRRRNVGRAQRDRIEPAGAVMGEVSVD